jgi:hypothetical protein
MNFVFQSIGQCRLAHTTAALHQDKLFSSSFVVVLVFMWSHLMETRLEDLSFAFSTNKLNRIVLQLVDRQFLYVDVVSEAGPSRKFRELRRKSVCESARRLKFICLIIHNELFFYLRDDSIVIIIYAIPRHWWWQWWCWFGTTRQLIPRWCTSYWLLTWWCCCDGVMTTAPRREGHFPLDTGFPAAHHFCALINWLFTG